jgi:hypothetical protein
LSNNAPEPFQLPKSVDETPRSPLAASTSRLFAPPEAQWLDLPGRYEIASNAPPRQLGAATLHTSQAEDLAQAALFGRIEREGLLANPQVKYGSDLERKIAGAFRPEVIHLGHAEFSCSLITAIARKNPLCLLDPSFFGMSF